MDEWDRKLSLHEMFLCAPCKTSESNITRYQCFDFLPHRLRRQDSICVNLFVGDCEGSRKLQCGIPWKKTRNQSWISASARKCLRALDSYYDLKLAYVDECLIFIGTWCRFKHLHAINVFNRFGLKWHQYTACYFKAIV